jgi:hypothetical protein
MRTAFPEINTTIAHLRDVLGDQTYESLARKGAVMTTTAIATYAYDQIDQARTKLNAVSKETKYEALKTSCRSLVIRSQIRSSHKLSSARGG